MIADYWFAPTAAQQVTTTAITCVIGPATAGWSDLTVVPERLVSRLRDAIGLPQIDTELEEFNRAFQIRAADARFASAFVDARMMAWLLEQGTGVGFEIVGGRVMVFRRRATVGLDDVADSLALYDAFLGTYPQGGRDRLLVGRATPDPCRASSTRSARPSPRRWACGVSPLRGREGAQRAAECFESVETEGQQLRGRFQEMCQDLRLHAHAAAREAHDLDATIGGEHLALDQLALFEPVDQPRRHRRIALQDVGDGAHGDRLVRLQRLEDTEVTRRQSERLQDVERLAALHPAPRELRHLPPDVAGDRLDGGVGTGCSL